MKRLLPYLLGLVLLLAATPCQATPVEFATVDVINAYQLLFSNSPSNQNTITVNERVNFHLKQPYVQDFLNAIMTLTVVSTTPAISVGGFMVQGGYSGVFQILDASGTELLLGGTFGSPTSGGALSGFLNGDSASLQDSDTPANPTEIVYTTAIPGLMFLPNTVESFVFSMGAVNSPVPPPPGHLRLNASNFVVDFSASGAGSFTADLVPEPLSLLLVGTGLAGLGLLRRRRS